jgi:hypothetical protein
MTWLPRSPGSTLVLWLNQETVHDFILLFMPLCGPHLTPLATGSLERSLLVFSTPGGPTGDDLFALVLHLHQHQSSRNLHLQYLAKNQSTQRCQSLITQENDHPPVLEPHMVLKLPLDECIDNTHMKVTREKRKKRNEQKETPTSDRKPNKGKEQDHLKKTSLGPLRQGQRLDTSETKQSSSKERKPPKQSSNNHKEPPCTHASSP